MVENELDLQSLLDTGLTVSLQINPRTDGLDVPDYLLEDQSSYLYLDIGHNLHIPIPDLLLTESGVSCTLSFNRVPYQCFIPHDAITGVGGPAVKELMQPKKKERPSWLRVIK